MAMNKYRILIVDDEPSIRTVLENILHLSGYEVESVSSGQEALQRVAQSPYDLLLLDLRMKPVDGMEVLNFIHEHYPDIVVIILTGYGTLESAVEALRLGAFDYLFKPASPDAIRKRVQEGLQHREKLIQRHRLQTHIDNLRKTLGELDQDQQSDLPPAADERILTRGRLEIDRYHRNATYDGSLLDLTTTEFDLLNELVSAAPEPVTSQHLVSTMMGYEMHEREASELIKWHIFKLRQKIEPDSKHPTLIKNVRYKGYLWSGE